MGELTRVAELTAAAGIGAAVFLGIGCAVASADTSSSSAGGAEAGRSSHIAGPRAARADTEKARARAERVSSKPLRQKLTRAEMADGSSADPDGRRTRVRTHRMDLRAPTDATPTTPPARRAPAGAALLAQVSAAWTTMRRPDVGSPAAVPDGNSLAVSAGNGAVAADPPRRALTVKRTQFEAPDGTTWRVWELRPAAPTGKTVVALSGDAVRQPTVTQWLDYTTMARSTGAIVVIPRFGRDFGRLATEITPKSPVTPGAEGVTAFLSAEIGRAGAGNVSVYADSASAQLARSAVDVLVAAGAPAPAHVVLPPGTVKSAADRSDLYRELGLNDAVTGPRTVVTDPPSLMDRLIVSTLQNLRRSAPGLFGGDASGLVSSSPPSFVRHGLTVTSSVYNGWTVWELAPKTPSGEYVLALHGGGFVVEANVINWADYAAMARDTGATVVVPVYPLAPPVGTGTVPTLIPPMADYLSTMIAEHGATNVSLYGDSAGGTFAMLTAQELIRRCRADAQCDPDESGPSRMVLISPVLNLTLSGPIVDDIDDPIIPKPQPGAGGPDITGGLDPNDPHVNPISVADLTGLPPTTIYVGTVERPLPGDLMFRDKLLGQDPGADLTVVIGDGQIHDWALGGIFVNSQARVWRPAIYQQLGLRPASD